MAEGAEQQAPGIVVADNSNRKHVDAEIGKIVDRVGAAAGDDGALAMPQDEHRRLAGDARNFAEDKFVRDHVAEHRHGDARECSDDLAQAVGFFGYAGHDEDSNLLSDFLTALARVRE